MADESTEAVEVEQTDGTEPASVPAEDDEPRFTQKQVNALIASEKRRQRRERSKEQQKSDPAPQAQAPELSDRLKELDERMARIDFREWAQEHTLGAQQRRYLEKVIDISDPGTWATALESESDILSRLAPEAPTRQAPKQPLTADSPGAGRVKDSLESLGAQDVSRMGSKELRDLWNREMKGSSGNGLFVAPNRRSKDNG